MCLLLCRGVSFQQETCRGVLDACLEPTDEPDEMRFYYTILEADQAGQTPGSSSFNLNVKTAFHRVLDSRNKVLLKT